MPHLPFTILLAALVAAALAYSESRPDAGRAWRAIYLFLCSMLIVVSGSWAMRWIHG